MEQENNHRRENLIKYIRANNPLFLFASFEHYTLEKLEKLKQAIDDIKSERQRKLLFNLN